MACELCGHAYAQKHRIKPGCWGGTYDEENVVRLCPNHHTGIHLLMKWYARGAARLGPDEAERLEAYAEDGPLWRFFYERVKPVVVERLTAEGKWFPYVRTLPEESRAP